MCSVNSVGVKYLCKSVKSVGEYSLPVCSVCSVNSVGVKYLCKSVKSVGEYSLPVCSVCSVNSVGVKYLCKSVKSVGEYSLPVCSVCSVNSVGVLFWLRGYGRDAIPSYVGTGAPIKTSSAGTTALRADRCQPQDSPYYYCYTPCRQRRSRLWAAC